MNEQSVATVLQMDKLSEGGENMSLKHEREDFSEQKRIRQHKLYWRVVICVAIFAGFGLCIGIMITIIDNQITYPIGRLNENNNICLSDECLRSAAALKQSMNFEVDPCDDFYEYVCGNWAEERPEDADGNNWIKERQLKIYRNIRTQLERSIKRFDPKPVAQAKLMYQSCLHAGQRKQEAAAEMAQYLHEFGLPTVPSLLTQSAPTHFDWVASVARIQRKVGLNVLIGFDVIPDHKNNNHTHLYLYYKIPRDPLRELNSDKDDNEFSNSTKLAQQLKRLAGAVNEEYNSTYFEEKFKHLGDKYMSFYNALPGVKKKNTNSDGGEEDDSRDYSVQELQTLTDAYLAPNKSLPIWKHYLDELFAPVPGGQPGLEDKLLLSNQGFGYLKKLVKIMSQQEPSVIELYIWERVMARFMLHEFDEKKSRELCAEHAQNYMGFAVSYLVADENFIIHTKPRVRQMLDNIREQFNEMVLETEWMDTKTKNATLEKSLAMGDFIGFPEWILDIEKLEQHFNGITKLYLRNVVNTIEFFRIKMFRTWRVNNKADWNQDPAEVNAFNDPVRNNIYIPVAFIQYPFYYLGLEALNYGAIGMVLGHELTHGFDDNGRFYDKFGNMKSWWSTHTHQEYEKRTTCMVEQYSSYSLPEGFVNGTLTLSENIADNGGLREALRAYRAFVNRHGAEPTLPGFDKFSHEQLLFISFANQNCEVVTPKGAKHILNDVHSPDKFRVKGVLSNMPEFSEAFRCVPGKAMNPEKKCRVW